MKVVWNSLLISLCLLPTSTSIVLAEPTAVIEEPIPHVPATSRRIPTPEQADRFGKLLAADKLYQAGDVAGAEKIYRQVKTAFSQSEPEQQPEPLFDAMQLSPAGRVYWREVEAGLAEKRESQVFSALQLLVERHPEFIPGQLQLVKSLQAAGETKEALLVLEKLTARYPDLPELIEAKVAALASSEKWLDASITARQFALFYPEHPEADKFARLADENLNRYKKHLRAKLRERAIAGSIIGGLGWALTGSPYGTISSVQTAFLLLRGESAIGSSIAKAAQRELPMVQDREVLDYVNEVGQKLAKVAGRNDFKYEFYVVLDSDLNAFALPGGKIFVNAGAITKSNSEAELAGLLAHELSHAVLSHGFQLLAEGNLWGNVTQFIPRGGILADVLVLNYSRDMERQADVLGTRILAASGYAADGLRNLMVTLEKQEKDYPIAFLSSHPGTSDRVFYLEKLIKNNRYNRYAFEGVERHTMMQIKLEKLLEERRKRRRNR